MGKDGTSPTLLKVPLIFILKGENGKYSIKPLDENPFKKLQLIWMYKESCRQVTGRCEYGPHSERAAGWRRCPAAEMTHRVARAGPGGDGEGGGREGLDRQAARCPCLGSCAMQSPSSSSSIGQTVLSNTCFPGI